MCKKKGLWERQIDSELSNTFLWKSLDRVSIGQVNHVSLNDRHLLPCVASRPLPCSDGVLSLSLSGLIMCCFYERSRSKRDKIEASVGCREATAGVFFSDSEAQMSLRVPVSVSLGSSNWEFYDAAEDGVSPHLKPTRYGFRR